MRPVEAWFARESVYFSASFVAGFEEVTDRADWRKWFATQFQVVQWTMGSVAQHPILHLVLRNIVAYYAAGRHLAAHKSVIKSTGPGIWSVAIAQHLRETYGVVFGRAPFGHAAMKSRGVRVGDVLLLPKPAFATQGGSCAEGQCMVCACTVRRLLSRHPPACWLVLFSCYLALLVLAPKWADRIAVCAALPLISTALLAPHECAGAP